MLLADSMPAEKPGLLTGYFLLGRLLERLAPLTDLLLRLAVFRVFFWSGLTKINDWSTTLLLFENEYNVPVLPHAVAAALATCTELGGAVLILIGLATRLAAIPLLGVSIVIQFVLGATDPAYNKVEHYLWMVLLLALIARGPGAWSLDAWLERHFTRSGA